ncbi:hypothetical protein SD78_3006 [Bacillus badius]|nr:hypothetical protein SD78_3006 [Bacillus badius]
MAVCFFSILLVIIFTGKIRKEGFRPLGKRFYKLARFLLIHN